MMPQIPKRAIAFAAMGLIGLSARSAAEVVAVWPGVPPGETAETGTAAPPPAPSGWVLPDQVTHVSLPSLTVFRPPPRTNAHVGLIVCPGGGFRELETIKEGEEAARWANTLGITAFVLQYRVPAKPGAPNYLAALQDLQRAISLVRSRAEGWAVAPDRIGVIGFSAGANIAARAGADASRAYPPLDLADQASCHPDFGIIIYPGGLLEPGTDRLDPSVRVTGSACQMFIVDAETDRVNSDNSTLLFLALKRAGASAELHVYAKGVHGFGLRPTTNPHGTWPERCADWLYSQAILPPLAASH